MVVWAFARKKHRKIHLRSVRMGLADSKKEGPAFEACLLPRHEGTVLVFNIAAHFERSREGLNSYWSRETAAWLGTGPKSLLI